jgi:hypothetical protein
MAIINAVCTNIDLGVVELNDLITARSYRELVEMQNFVFRDSRSMIYSFAYSGGWAVPGSQLFVLFECDIPKGIDRILITSRGDSIGLEFIDYTAAVTMATNTHGSPADTLSATYAIPAPGIRVFGIASRDGGTVDAILIEWDAQTIP